MAIRFTESAFVSSLFLIMISLVQTTLCQIFQGTTEHPSEGSPHLQDPCIRVRFDMQSMTTRTMKAMYCYMNHGGPGPLSDFLHCLEEEGIRLSDPDMKDVLQV